MTCAWIETSSADTGSSSRISYRIDGQRTRDPDPLALTAGELVREAVDVLAGQARRGRAAGGSRRSIFAFWTPRILSGVARICETRLRGFSDACGSWNTICISRRIGSSSLAARIS